VCFTHFIYLSADALICPELLKYAYRRTAAIVPEQGRKGIDWIIPVRIKKENDDNNEWFVGLVGQDKNRVNDSLLSLQPVGNDETHWKLSTQYFLSNNERDKFSAVGWNMYWPSIFFAIGSGEQNAGRVDISTRKLRSDTSSKEIQIPCMICTGLGYTKLVDSTSSAEIKLQELRDFVFDPPEMYQKFVPITHGRDIMALAKIRRDNSDNRRGGSGGGGRGGGGGRQGGSRPGPGGHRSGSGRGGRGAGGSGGRGGNSGNSSNSSNNDKKNRGVSSGSSVSSGGGLGDSTESQSTNYKTKSPTMNQTTKTRKRK
jgi:hypothetical protein